MSTDRPISRRDFIKSQAALAAASVAGVTLPAELMAQAQQQQADPDIRWDKAPCRFCGTGCSVLVGVKDGKVVASQGDPDAPVNRGLNCIKGYFLPKILYGQDRLTQPLLRKKDGKFDKEGDFEAVTWDEAFDVMADHWKAAIKRSMEENQGKTVDEMTSRVGLFGSGQWTVWEGYAASKLLKGGMRSNNLDPNARHCMASAVGAFIRAFGIDEPMGCYDDLEHADVFVLWGANMAEMHPILWSRLTDTRLSKPGCEVHVLVHLRAPLLRAGRQPDRVHAADGSGHAELHRQLHYPDQGLQPGLHRQARPVRDRDDGHRLRSAP